MDKSTKDNILKNNPKSDSKVVSDYERLETKLKKLGAETQPKYSLSPPLGGVSSPRLINPQSSLKKIKGP